MSDIKETTLPAYEVEHLKQARDSYAEEMTNMRNLIWYILSSMEGGVGVPDVVFANGPPDYTCFIEMSRNEESRTTHYKAVRRDPSQERNNEE